MEIVQIDKCGISDDIIKYKFKEWVDFHKNNKIVDVNNFEILKNTSVKSNRTIYKYDEIIEIEIDEIIDINNYEEISFDRDIYTICKDIFGYKSCDNNFIYSIIYDKKLVGIALIDGFDSDEIYITDLLLSNNCDWYNIIYNIIIFYNNKNNNEMIYINFNHYMKEHLIIEDIMKGYNFNNIHNKTEYMERNYYILKLQNTNYNYDNKYTMQIIGYRYETKQEMDILFNHTTNIGILFTDKQDCNYPVFNKYKCNYKIDEKIHTISKYSIILKQPIIIDYKIDDIYIDIYIEMNNKKFKLNINEPHNLRLNKLSIDYINMLSSYSYVYQINCYYNNCKCDYCKSQLRSLLIEYNKYNNKDNKDDKKYIELINQYYYGYYNSSYGKSNYNLYNFIVNNLTYYRKPHKNFINEKIKLNKSIKILNLTEFNTLDLSCIFEYDNNQDITLNKDVKENIDIKENIDTKENIDFKENKHKIKKSISDIKNDTTLNTEYNYIYLIQKYDVNLKKDLYKFGKTNRHFNERIKEHGREAKVLIILDVDDCNIIETNILKVLRNDTKINERKDIGNEYFYCDNKQYIINLILKNIYL
jgi:hypothetical protein